MIGGLEIAASYGPKPALVLDEPVSKHGSEAADRLVMTSAEQCSDLDQETARIRASAAFSRAVNCQPGRSKVISATSGGTSRNGSGMFMVGLLSCRGRAGQLRK